MNGFEDMFRGIGIVMIIGPIIGVLFFLAILTFIILLIFSPKFKAKLMGNQIKAVEYTVHDNKDSITHIGSDVGDIVAETGENILNKNEDKLKDISSRGAKIMEDGIETTVGAITKGISNNINKK
jgi:hypothetical protein